MPPGHKSSFLTYVFPHSGDGGAEATSLARNGSSHRGDQYLPYALKIPTAGSTIPHTIGPATVINIAQTPHMHAPHLIPDGEVQMLERTYSTHHEII
jgi:hypothetical protein